MKQILLQGNKIDLINKKNDTLNKEKENELMQNLIKYCV